MYIHHSFEDKLRAVDLYGCGVGSASVGGELGVSKDQVLRWVKAYAARGESGLRRQAYHCPTSAFKSEVVGYVLKKAYLVKPPR